MAAPTTGMTWGAVVGDYCKLGIYIDTTNTSTKTDVTVEIWLATKWSLSDSNNTLYYDVLGKAGSASTSVGSVSINTTNNSSWSKSNEVKLKEYKYSYTREASASTKYVYAKLTGLTKNEVKGKDIPVETTFVVPALDTTACTAPNVFTVSPSVFEDGVSLTWSGAGGGHNNSITGYNIQCAVSNNGGSSWGQWTQIWQNNQTSVTLSGEYLADKDVVVNRGDYVKFQIQTIGSAGSNYSSEWKASDAVRKNSCPGTPSSLVVDSHVVAPGGKITVSWGASTDVDGNHDGYRVARSPIGDEEADCNGYVTIAKTGTTSIDVTTPNAAGQSIEIAVRAEDSLGAYSTWSCYGDILLCGTSYVGNNLLSYDRYLAHIYLNGEESTYIPYVGENGIWKECK